MFDKLLILNITEVILLGAMALLFVAQLYYYIRYIAGIQRRVRHQEKRRFRWREDSIDSLAAEGMMDEEDVPGVSVVVCARNEGENLQAYLQAVLSQKYPKFEVIVVNDASEDDTQLVLDHYTKLYRNLRITFVPNEAWVRSSKKLALTLAAKAAKYDYLLMTDADCRPETPYWIEEMMKGFRGANTEVVLGYGGYYSEPTKVNRLIQYDTVFTTMQYMGMAMSGHPYMGVGRNLAYKRSTFFENKGFAGILNERAGDDDLFVNKVATPENTEVVLTRKSYTWSVPKSSYAEWRVQKYRQLSATPSFRTSTKLRLAFEPVTRALWYVLMIAIAVLAIIGIIENPLVWISAVILFLTRLTWQMKMTARAAEILGVHSFGLHVLWYDIFLPISNASMLLKHIIRKKQELLW